MNTSSDATNAFHFSRLIELKREPNPQTDWLWPGYLAPGNITLLTSQWKAGKTTLLSLLLDRMRHGGELADLAVKAGKAVVLSEESASLWVQRSKRFGFARHVFWLCRPFTTRPSLVQWLALLDQLLSLHQQLGLSLVAIDTLTTFLPSGCENNPDRIMSALLPLERLTAAGLSVLLLHHPRKRSVPDGQAARGTGALCSHVDILLELHWYTRADDDNRRRRLLGWSRHDATPRQRVIELSADGREYAVVKDAVDEGVRPAREALRRLLLESPTKLTLAEIMEDWPPDCPKPAPVTLWRLLEKCLQRGEIRRDAAGTKNDPYRYWLPEHEERWRTDALARIQQQVADARRIARLGFRPSPAEEP